jgi:hypothetical protein
MLVTPCVLASRYIAGGSERITAHSEVGMNAWPAEGTAAGRLPILRNIEALSESRLTPSMQRGFRPFRVAPIRA